MDLLNLPDIAWVILFQFLHPNLIEEINRSLETLEGNSDNTFIYYKRRHFVRDQTREVLRIKMCISREAALRSRVAVEDILHRLYLENRPILVPQWLIEKCVGIVAFE